MKPRDERVERLEGEMKEAHLSRPATEADERWRRTLMADIRGRAAGMQADARGDAEAVFASVGRLAPALAAAALVLFVFVWLSFSSVYDDVAFTVATATQGSMELSVMGF